MRIIKRNGSEVEFKIDKIKNAIRGACSDIDETDRMTNREIDFAAENVTEHCMNAGHIVTVEEVQDLVENQLMALNHFEVARAYITWRYEHAKTRAGNTTDAKILSIVDCTNELAKQENSNKNPDVVSVQRDYVAGEISRDMTVRKLLPPEIVKAHEEGIIHFHDSDYFLQRMHNCFVRSTRFMTTAGTKSFEDFEDGDTVEVFDAYGDVRRATVHCHGVQLVYKYTFSNDKTSLKRVLATENHRWLLEDGSETTALAVGDRLLKAPRRFSFNPDFAYSYKVIDKQPIGEREVWCLNVEDTHSFILSNGIPTGNCDLINLEDMLQNGTVISGTMIERPHSFSTACISQLRLSPRWHPASMAASPYRSHIWHRLST